MMSKMMMMIQAGWGDLDGDSWKIYDYIVRHFIATVSQNCKYLQTTAAVTVGEETFTFTGKKVTEEGFTGVMTWQAVPQVRRLFYFLAAKGAAV